MNEIESHNGIKGTASPVYFQRKSLPGHKGEKRTRLETNSLLKYKCKRGSDVSGYRGPGILAAAANYSMNWWNISRSFGLKGNPHPKYIFKVIWIIQVNSSLLFLLNYLSDWLCPSAPPLRTQGPSAFSGLPFLSFPFMWLTPVWIRSFCE